MGLRLAVIGDTQHYRDESGRFCALEPVVNQLDRWAELFDELVLCAPLGHGPPPAGFAPYQAGNLRIEPLRSGGGETLAAKVGMLRNLVPWLRTTRRVAKSVDAVHLRCPCNVALVAIFSTVGTGSYRYAMYAGVWLDHPGQPWSYRLQRRLLAHPRFGGPVSVYADPDPSRPHLEPFFSPSFSEDHWRAATALAEEKVRRVRNGQLTSPLRLVTVGRFSPNKNQRTIVLAVRRLLDAGLAVTLDLYGDGPSRGDVERLVEEIRLSDAVTFHGSVSHSEVMAALGGADLNLLATRQEGYGKVLLEGMMFATVPIFGTSPVSGEISGRGSRGLVFDPDDAEALASHILGLMEDPQRWASMAEAARAFSRTVTLDAFQVRVKEMLERQWGVELRNPPTHEERP